MRDDASRGCVPPYSLAVIHLGLGENGLALDWLEKAYVERDWRLPWIGPEPSLDSLRGEPRYDALLCKLGLPVASTAPR